MQLCIRCQSEGAEQGYLLCYRCLDLARLSGECIEPSACHCAACANQHPTECFFDQAPLERGQIRLFNGATWDVFYEHERVTLEYDQFFFAFVRGSK